MSREREYDGAEPSGFVPALRQAAIPAGRGCLIVAVVTAAAFRLHLNAAAVACIFMIAVVVNCLDGGPWAAATVSVMAVGCLDFFFTQPVFSFNVNDPVDGIALVAFLTSSLLVSRLAGKARQEARTARRDRSHLERLYELAQRLIALDPSRLDEPILLDAVRSVFHLKAAALFDAATAQLYVSGDAAGEVGDRTRQAYIMGQDSDESERHAAFRQLRPGGKAVGAIGLDGLEDERVMGGPVAALAAAGLERGRTVRAASRAVAEAEGEALRAAVLDALAHEFKTPLATILTAAGGLREAGPLQPEQAELAEIVETEAERLSDLSFHLLQLAKLDRAEIRARSEPANIVEIVTAVVGRYARRSPDRQILFRHQAAPEETWLDLELYPLALSQLLDNACRYSPPRSTIEVDLKVQGGFVAVTVLNGGAALSVVERGRIFERFYRGEAGRRASSGTGLGLYVARKIAYALGGSLNLDEAQSEEGGVAFRLAIPLAGSGSQDGAATTSQGPNR